jgi:hypothetical protein
VVVAALKSVPLSGTLYEMPVTLLRPLWSLCQCPRPHPTIAWNRCCRQPNSVAPSKVPQPRSCDGAGAASRWGGTRGRLEVRIIEARNLTFGSGVLNKFHTLVRWTAAFERRLFVK